MAEFIVVYVDNSAEAYRLGTFQPQLDAVEHYCKTKLDDNPDNEVSLFATGSSDFRIKLDATSDFKAIQEKARWLLQLGPTAGSSSFQRTLSWGLLGFIKCPPNKQKRLLLLVGSFADVSEMEVEERGSILKKMGMAVDVVSFYLEENPENPTLENQFWRMNLDALVRAANSNDNSHIEHIVSIPHALSKSILRKTPRRSRKKNRKKAKRKNHAAGDNKHVRSEALSLENEGVFWTPRPSRKKNRKKAKRKNQAAGDNKHVRSEALSLENEGVKLGKRKAVLDL